MAEAFAVLNGQRVSALQLHVPTGGVWYADVELDTPAPQSGAADLRIATQRFVGTISPVHGGSFAGKSKWRVYGGANGWGKVLPPRDYHNDATLRKSTVALAAAQEAGETLAFLAGADATVDGHYTRGSIPAAKVLDQLGLTWWVAYDGITWAGARPASVAGADVEVLDFDPAGQVATLALDTPASAPVGAVLRSKKLPTEQTIQELAIVAGGGKFRAIASCRPVGGKSRAARALERFARGAFPNYAFTCKYRYRVFSQQEIGEPGFEPPGRLDLQAVKKIPGLPDILPVSIWPGMMGVWARIPPSVEVLVEFIEGDPTQPIVTGFMPRVSPVGDSGFLPFDLYIDALEDIDIGEEANFIRIGRSEMTSDSGGRPVCYGENVTVGTETGSIQPASVPATLARVRFKGL